MKNSLPIKTWMKKVGELNKWAKLSRARKSEQSKETVQNFTFLDSDQTDLPGNEQSNAKEEEADSQRSLRHSVHGKSMLLLFGRTSTCLHVCICRIRRLEHNVCQHAAFVNS